MRSLTSSSLRVVVPVVRACAVALLFWACTASPPQDVMLSYSCAAPPADLASCSADADCATVTAGCYCGAQPVNGVAHKYATAAQGCEETAASACALGCANGPGMLAQDGKTAEAVTSIGFHCDHTSGATGTCKSYVPSLPSGPGDPPTGW